MKKTFVEQMQTHMAWNRNKYCPSCGEHEFTVVEQIEPFTLFPWSIRCLACGYETGQYSVKEGAMSVWEGKNHELG